MSGPTAASSEAPQSFWHLKECSLFDCLSDDELGALSRSVRLDIILRRQHLAYDDPGKECLFFVKSGFLKILRVLDDGAEVLVDVIGPGEIFGRLREPHRQMPTTRELAEASEQATVCVLQRNEFERYLEQTPHLQREIIATLDDRVERIQQRFVDLAFRSAPQRLAAFLDRFVEEYGRQQHGVRRATMPLSQQELGYLVGMSRQSVTTLLNEWRQNGVIAFDRRELAITDHSHLQHIIEGS